MSKTTIFVIGICFFILAGTLSADQSPKIHPWVFTNTAGGQQAEFFIVLKERADLSAAFQMSRKIDRGNFVYRTLFDTAQRSQTPIKDWLQARGIKYQSFYIINALLITAGRDIVDQLAARDDVDRIEGNPLIRNKIPEPVSQPDSPEAIEWNIIKTKAPDMWNLGYTGQGIVVGGADTGYRWTHNAIKGKYRGWNGTTADHDYNWHDSIHSGGGSCGANSPVPCDDFGHGTHTMGTIVGDDGGSNQVGMAPGAKWIGCRNMNVGNGTPATYIECFEFFLAPYPVGGTPSQGDPALAPDVTSNSWSCPASEGCSPTSLQAAVDAQKAAGIMTVAAAQNSGPSCGTVDDPIGTYGSTYTVGSTTNTPNNLLSSFSSRGPADSTGLTKPNIVAPGSSVRSASSSSDSSYSISSGTSMATPNVAGGIAIVWSALPTYKNDQDATETLLNGSALRLPHIVEACGGDYVNGPNNSWGHGLMDVLAAFNAGCTPPAAPQNLASSLTVDNEVSLTWDPVLLGGGTTYEVFRGSGACPGSGFTQIGNPSVNSFLDSTVSGGNTYSYMVKAVDVCASAFSNCTDETIPCSYLLTPDNATIPGAGGSATFDVTTGSGCNWTAVANDSWIHITSGNGTGNGTVNYSVDANPDTTSRTGTITVADQTFTVNQDPGTSSCVFCDDFEDGIPPANWTFVKPTWNETGGSLVGTPSGKKAVAVATPAFAGCLNCTVQAQMQTAGGTRNILWLLGWWVDKRNTMELLMKQESGRWILKQRSGGRVVAKARGISPIAVGTTYNVSLSFNGTQFQLLVDSVPVLTLAPVGTVPTGTVGFQVRNTTGSFGEVAVN